MRREAIKNKDGPLHAHERSSIVHVSAEDLVPILTRFHRQIVLPDIKQVVEESVVQLRDEMHTMVDGLAQRLDKLETEYHMLVIGLKRVEERLERIEQKLDKTALRSELVELKSRVDGLQAQIRALESRLGESS